MHLPKIDAKSAGCPVWSRITTATELYRLQIEHVGLRSKIGAAMCFTLHTSHWTSGPKFHQVMAQTTVQSVSPSDKYRSISCDRPAYTLHCGPTVRLVSQRSQLLQSCASATCKVTGKMWLWVEWVRAVTRGHNYVCQNRVMVEHCLHLTGLRDSVGSSHVRH